MARKLRESYWTFIFAFVGRKNPEKLIYALVDFDMDGLGSVPD